MKTRDEKVDKIAEVQEKMDNQTAEVQEKMAEVDKRLTVQENITSVLSRGEYK